MFESEKIEMKSRHGVVFCVSEKERDEAEDLVFAMVWCVGDPVTDEEVERFEKEREEALKRFEKEREDDEKVWGRERRKWRGLRKREKFERDDSVWDTERWKCLFLIYFLIFKILRRWHVNIFSCCRK